MAETGADRAVYEGRVNAAIDYVEAHLADELTIEQLAEVAHFSPFHFHRIFSAVTGETIGAFVARVRVERAATLLSARLCPSCAPLTRPRLPPLWRGPRRTAAVGPSCR